MISNFWGPWLFKDNIKALILMWGVFIQLCFYALYEAHANHLQKKSEWQFLLLFLHWTLSSSIIACAMGMWFTKPLDLPLPFFSFQLHTHLNGWGWQWLSDKRETLKKRMAFLIFFFFCFDSYDLPPPSHYSHPDGCRCHSHRLENYSSYLKKKNYFGHDGMSFLFFFWRRREEETLVTFTFRQSLSTYPDVFVCPSFLQSCSGRTVETGNTFDEYVNRRADTTTTIYYVDQRDKTNKQNNSTHGKRNTNKTNWWHVCKRLKTSINLPDQLTCHRLLHFQPDGPP